MSDTYKYKPPFGLDIRVNPPGRKGRGRTRKRSSTEERKTPQCGWPGCEAKGEHKAPKSRDRLNEYHHFCLDHVRAYNRSWNFFDGMSDEDVAAFQEQARAGHRPTWAMGANPSGGYRGEARATGGRARNGKPAGDGFVFGDMNDTFGLFGDAGDINADYEPRRGVSRLTAKALQDLGLDERASLQEVKARYKELVKRFHPDANGGDRSAEDSLQRVIRAYQTLRANGFH